MKYEILQYAGIGESLSRICALKDIPGVVKAGELGGFVTNEHNLSQKGRCWLDYNSTAAGPAVRVTGSAQIINSRLYDYVTVSGLAIVKNSALYDKGEIGGFAEINREVLSGHYRIMNAADAELARALARL